MGGHQIGHQAKVAESEGGAVTDTGQLATGERARVATGLVQVAKELANAIAAGPDEPLIVSQAFDAVTNAGGLQLIHGGDFNEWHEDGFTPLPDNLFGSGSGLVFGSGNADRQAEERELLEPVESAALEDAFAEDQQGGGASSRLANEFCDVVQATFNDLLGWQ
jgi:hypothetical protein